MNLPSSFIRKITLISVLAGVIYSSWPLGYWLNPTVAHSGLASGFEATGQPYNWLFIGLDVLSSLMMIYVARALWQCKHGSPSIPIRLVLLSVVVFAVGTIISALLPEQCVPGLQQCPSFTQDHTLLIHGIFSLAGSVALFVGLSIAWFKQRESTLLGSLMFGYVIFGLVSLIEAVKLNHGGNWSQHFYITLCSVWLAAIPYAIAMLARNADTATTLPSQP